MHVCYLEEVLSASHYATVEYFEPINYRQYLLYLKHLCNFSGLVTTRSSFKYKYFFLFYSASGKNPGRREKMKDQRSLPCHGFFSGIILFVSLFHRPFNSSLLMSFFPLLTGHEKMSHHLQPSKG